ncbi:MAG TPA: type II restriction endonuclease [Candidatus Saccharibacteria bacterium]|nr:type II restriction endonuclease [Candidatus Saccharibacteria bacterium]
MKRLDYYKQNNLITDDDIFNHLIKTLRPGISDWEYFVNWDKAFYNTRAIESTLNVMNYLLGKEKFDSEFRYLAQKYPEIIAMIPILIVRNGNKSSDYQVVTVNGSSITEEAFNFSGKNHSDEDINKAILFIHNSGLIRIFENDGVKNLVDYVLGVEAGLSSNGRKNRGGKAMENVCDALLQGMNIEYISQASSSDIKNKFGLEINDTDGRRFDFALKVNDKLYIIEVNCYSSGGSKLDKTASDYRGLQDDLRNQATFIWLTDGQGWLKAKNPLHKTFDHNDYILNIEMVNRGAFVEILNS